MKTRLLISFILFSIFSQAQIIYNPNYFNPVTIQCPQDTSQVINTFVEWEAYQTMNDAWDGPKDSIHCFNIDDPGPYGAQLLMNESDTTRSIFLRLKLDSINKIPLDSNNLYKFMSLVYPQGNLVLDTGNSCASGYCSGAILGIEIDRKSTRLNSSHRL